jgi:prepilin-type N-terminal cleavage/methylation domain-containing protein
MSHRAPIYNAKGFTLVEVLVSLACMAICFVAVWALHFSSVRMDSRNQQETDAINVATSELERLRAKAQEDGFASFVAEGNANDVPVQPFTLDRTIVADAALPWRATVIVTVRWREKTGGFGTSNATIQRRVQMRTVIVNLT